VEEARGCVRNEAVDLLGGDDAGADQRGEALHGGEEEEPDVVRFTGLERAARLSLVDRELITGQDPYSAKAMGKAFVDQVLRAVREPAPAQAN
jgi:hypothetical protein